MAIVLRQDANPARLFDGCRPRGQTQLVARMAPSSLLQAFLFWR
jgi:hypothetical protein